MFEAHTSKANGIIYTLLFVKCPEYSISYGIATFKKLRRGM